MRHFMNGKIMRIAILGAGGVGGYFGARLAASGYDVTFVARGRHLEAMRSKGLRVESATGNISLDKVNVVGSASDVGDVDLVFVTVKLWDTDEAAQSLIPVVAKGAAVISFQNGVGKDEVLRKYLPPESVIGGVSFISSIISQPGVIAHSGTMQKLVFGEYDGSQSARLVALQAACEKAGIDSEISADIQRIIWEKFVFLVGLSGTTTATRKPIGVIRDNPNTRALLLEVMQEVVSVGQAKGVALPVGFAQNRLSFCDTLPASMTSSMHNDLERGNRIELPWLSAAVAELGAQRNVATPCNRTIANILSPYVAGEESHRSGSVS
jgi:2-dehydropantoate 2-reductase